MTQRVRTIAQQEACELLLQCAERLDESTLDMSNYDFCLCGQAHEMNKTFPRYADYAYILQPLLGITIREHHLLFGFGEAACQDVTKAEVVYNVRRLVNGEQILPYNDKQRAIYSAFKPNDRYNLPAGTLTVRERMKFDDDKFVDAVMPELTTA